MRSRIGAWLIQAASFRVGKDAHGPRAGACIAVLGGRCAEKGGRMDARTQARQQLAAELGEYLSTVAESVEKIAAAFSQYFGPELRPVPTEESDD